MRRHRPPRILFRTVHIAIIATLLLSTVASAKTLTLFYRSNNNNEMLMVRELIELYESRFPDVKVELIPSGTGGGINYTEKLMLLRASGQMPDLFHSSADKAGYLINGWVMDITPYYQRDFSTLNTRDFLPGVLEAFKRGGKLFGIPAVLSGQGLYYNVDIFQKSGLALLPVDWNDKAWTWEDFVSYCQKLTRLNPDGSVQQVGVNMLGEYKLPDLAWIFGGDWFPPEAYVTGIAHTSILDSPQNLEAYRAAQDLYEHGWVGDAVGADPWSGFMSGITAMEWVGWWKVTTFRNAKLSFAWNMAPMPKKVTRNHTLWFDTVFISADTDLPEEAWQFHKLYTSSEGQKLMQKYLGHVPTRFSALEAYINATTQNTALSPPEVLTYISGATEHGRISVEELIYGGIAISSQMQNWIQAMLVNREEPAAVMIARVKPQLDALLAEYAAKAPGK